jgi:hypothetical protein
MILRGVAVMGATIAKVLFLLICASFLGAALGEPTLPLDIEYDEASTHASAGENTASAPISEGGAREIKDYYGEWMTTNYTMFFGRWEIADIVATADGKDAENRIRGEVVEFYSDYAIAYGERYDCPRYSTSILPTYPPGHELRDSYHDFMPYPTELGVTGNYYVQLFVNFPGRTQRFPMGPFLIVDDSTLILLHSETYYKITRLAYADEGLQPQTAPAGSYIGKAER